MQGRSRLDKYQSLQNNRFDSPSNSGFERPGQSNSFSNTQNYNNFERPSNNYDTNEFDSLLKGNEDFLNSLDQDLTQIGRGSSDRFARNDANNFNNGYNQPQNNYQQNPYPQATNSFNTPNQYNQPQQPYGYQQPQQGYAQPQYNQQPVQPQQPYGYQQPQQGYVQPQYNQQPVQPVQPQVVQPITQQPAQPQYAQPVAPQVTPVAPQVQPMEQMNMQQPQVAPQMVQQPVAPQVQPMEQMNVQQPQVVQPQQVTPVEVAQPVQPQTNTISPMDRLEGASLPPYAPITPVQPQPAVLPGVDQNVANIFTNTSQNVVETPVEQPVAPQVVPASSIVFGDNYANTQQVQVQPEQQPQQAPNINDDEDALDDIFASFEELAADETVTTSNEQSISPMPGNESLQNVLSEFDNLTATANTQQISTIQQNTNSDNAFDYVNDILGNVDALTASSTVDTAQENIQAAFNAEFNQTVNTPKDPFAELEASSTIATQAQPVAQPSNTAQQPVFYDDPLNIQSLSTELNQQRTINQKLIEQTQEMSLKMSEYENEINDTQSSMSRTSKVLNLMLTLLIITLFAILIIIGFWFAQERGLI